MAALALAVAACSPTEPGYPEVAGSYLYSAWHEADPSIHLWGEVNLTSSVRDGGFEGDYRIVRQFGDTAYLAERTIQRGSVDMAGAMLVDFTVTWLHGGRVRGDSIYGDIYTIQGPGEWRGGFVMRRH